MADADERPGGPIRELWGHPWGRVLMIAVTIAVVSWALRETAGVTRPVVTAVGSVLLPLSIGFTIAYILSPLVDALERVRISRLVSSSVIYLIFFGGLVVAGTMLVPMVVNQSTALVTRVVEDIHFLDLDADGRQDRHEPPLLLQRGAGDVEADDRLFADRNRNGRRDSVERLYERTDPRVRRRPSIISQIRDWIERRGERFRILLGVEIDEVSLGGLRFYHELVREPIGALDRGMSAAADPERAAAWLAGLDAAALEEVEPVARIPAWPGRTADAFTAAREGLPPDLGERWEEAMRRLTRSFREQHERAIAAFDLLAAGTGDGDELVQRLRRLQQDEVPLARREDLTAFWQRLQASRRRGHPFATEVLERLLIGGDGGDMVRDFARSVREHLGTEMEGVNQSMARSVAQWIKHLLSNVGHLLRFSLDLILIPIYAFFLTVSMPKLRLGLRALVPRRHREQTLRIARGIERVVASFFRGRLIVCAICAVLVYVGFALIGVPYAALFAICIGLATTVPLLGLVFLIPALMLVTLDGGQYMLVRLLATAGLYSVVQTLEAVVLTPTIMGREVELHPVVLIVAFLVFGSLWGIVGLILAVPIAATLRILAREFLYPRLGIAGGDAPDPAEADDAPPG